MFVLCPLYNEVLSTLIYNLDGRGIHGRWFWKNVEGHCRVLDICLMELSKTRETSASIVVTPTSVQSGYLHCNSVAITLSLLVEYFTQDLE